MKQGLRTAASIALATTCAAAAPLHSEAGETLPAGEVCRCQMQEFVAKPSNVFEIASPVSNQGTRMSNEMAAGAGTIYKRDGKET